MRQTSPIPDSGPSVLPRSLAATEERGLIDAAIAINGTEALDDALDALASAGLELLGATRTTIAVWDDGHTHAVIRAGAGEGVAQIGTVLLPGPHLAWECLQAGEPRRSWVAPQGLPPEVQEAVAALAVMIAVPLQIEGETRITFQAGWRDEIEPKDVMRAMDTLDTLGRMTAITRRADRERDRASESASLDAVLESVGDGVLIVRGENVRMNLAARRILGAESGEIDWEALHLRTLDGRALAPDERPGHVALATGEAQRFRYRIRNMAGVELIVDGTLSPTNGGLVGMFRDVTSDHLREFLNEQYLRALFDAIPTAIVLADPTSHAVVSGNRAFLELVGYDLQNVIGQVPPYPWWAEPDSMWVEPEGSGETRHERLYRRSDGRLVPVRIMAQLIRDHDQRPLSALSLINDQSERRRLEQQLVQSGKLAAIGELAAGVAHEINNPLFAILGLVEFLLKDAEPGSKARERLTLVQQTGLEIKEIVRSLLDFARENSEERQLVSLEEVVSQTIDLIRRTSASKGVELLERYESGGAIVNASPNQIKQIFLNLLGNARQAMPSGGSVTIDVRREGDGVLATVTDTGPGIPTELQPRIFEPFFTTKRDSGGTGLGLSVSLGIAEAHGGSLTVESHPGTGAAFTLLLPLAEEEA